MFFDQGISAYELFGISCAVMATLMITLCDEVIEKVCKGKKTNGKASEEKLVTDNEQDGPVEMWAENLRAQ